MKRSVECGDRYCDKTRKRGIADTFKTLLKYEFTVLHSDESGWAMLMDKSERVFVV